MFYKCFKFIILILILNLYFLKNSYSEIIKEIRITGNDRISKETILMFSNISEEESINNNILNDVLKNLYSSDFLRKFL